ncbi:MAG TPA: ribose-5-phosphate isomerase RpiA [Thermoanaerobaculia bacterium]|nr:ribose-5-phosphate isomerase RpiA [Thermoanaerobaculia bacterium]
MAIDLKSRKIEAARVALGEIRSGMTLGLGTGSTATELVALLGAAYREGRIEHIRATCTSVRTEELARSFAIPLHPLEDLAPLDLAIDGADEIDRDLRLIKGLGGALLREKIVEQAAKRFVVIADESKLVDRLGRGVLPVEVVLFACRNLERSFNALGLQPKLRRENGGEYVTDEGHRILDIVVPAEIDIADLVLHISDMAGVVETGFFPREATDAIIASSQGVSRMTRTRSKP